MAPRPALLARLGLIVPAAFAGLLVVAAHRAPERVEATPPPHRAIAPSPVASPTPGPIASPEPPAYVVRSVLPVEGMMRIGDTYWNDAHAPDGPVVITVDLHAKVLSIFRAGHEIGTAAILYGGDDKPTPLGVFPITQKDARHRSNIYGGAPMPYMMRLTNDGISIHGSPGMRAGQMTHGCVGVPVAFAKKLFGAAKLGTKVIVTNGERLDVGRAITAA